MGLEGAAPGHTPPRATRTFLGLGDALLDAHLHYSLVIVCVGKVGEVAAVLVQEALEDASSALQGGGVGQ